MSEKTYICIDLKCFYASVECVDKGLDPFKSNLVVANPTHGRGGICLAISPALKARGIKNRCRLFEIPTNIEYITAMPRMRRYMEVSAQIYSVYLKYIAPEDIHIYSIDECFIDATPYIKLYNKTGKEFAKMLIDAVLKETGICAAAGIGTNLFLAKIALDITAKKNDDHIGYLDERIFKKDVWFHQPLADIWGIGRGISKRLAVYGIYDLHGITKIEEEVLYKEFGVNAEILIDHAYGKECCTMQDIKAFKPKSNSISNGQILFKDYNINDAFIVLKEMIDVLTLELTDKKMVTQSVFLTIHYSKNIIPKTGGMKKLKNYTNAFSELCDAFEQLYFETTNPEYPIRKINVGFAHIIDQDLVTEQLTLFSEKSDNTKEKNLQKAVLKIKNKYGKNSILRGLSFQEQATAKQRNQMIGGHHE